jgi:hypothetical protein
LVDLGLYGIVRAFRLLFAGFDSFPGLRRYDGSNHQLTAQRLVGQYCFEVDASCFHFIS